MKRLKIGILTTVIVCMLAGFEATAENTVDSAAKNGPSPVQITYRKGEIGPHGGKVILVDTSGMHGVAVKSEDEPDSMTWDAAVIAVQKYGEGWRLPTIDELRLMYEQRKRIGGFDNEDYWSAKEQDVNSAWIQGFRLGDQDRYNKQSKLKVRAVRSF